MSNSRRRVVASAPNAIQARQVKAGLLRNSRSVQRRHMHSRSRGALRPRLTGKSRPSVEQRARGMPGAQCTRSLVCAQGSQYAHQSSQRRHRENIRHSPRNGFTAYSALSPATNSSCHRRPADCMASHIPVGLSASARLSINNGCQDHTTSPSATLPLVSRAALDRSRVASPCDLMRTRQRRVHRIPPHVS